MATTLLDLAASEVRDASLEPVPENIEHIGRAIAEAFEVQLRIFELRPDLRPAYLDEPSPHPEADRLLTEFMFRASELELRGEIGGAIAEFERFAALESTDFHRDIALGEIERLKNV